MKTQSLQTPGKNGNGPNRFHSLAILRSFVLVGAMFFTATSFAAANFIAHEWGTFTSVQGGDGKLLLWHPLQSSELPDFVYNWQKAGMNRGWLVPPKFSLVTLQRMETPVIYFYANQPMNVTVDVRFPKGYLTEWYPQATQIGPSFPLDTNGPADGILKESRAVWRDLEIIPAPADNTLESQLPQDTRGSHYFAARATGGNILRTGSIAGSEMEKFIFYRGAGSFKTPLRVTMDENNFVTVTNEGSNAIGAVFLVSIEKTNSKSFGGFSWGSGISGGHAIEWPLMGQLAINWSRSPLPEFQRQIAGRMETALVAQGLFPDEAQAMVNTWKDSWFTEPGVRVLYILPRAWTDEILPITMTPQPTELARVMIGRAEVITPGVEMNLFHSLTEGREGDQAARTQAANILKGLGRFAEAALNLANKHAIGTNVTSFGYPLLPTTQ